MKYRRQDLTIILNCSASRWDWAILDGPDMDADVLDYGHGAEYFIAAADAATAFDAILKREYE